MFSLGKITQMWCVHCTFVIDKPFCQMGKIIYQIVGMWLRVVSSSRCRYVHPWITSAGRLDIRVISASGPGLSKICSVGVHAWETGSCFLLVAFTRAAATFSINKHPQCMINGVGAVHTRASKRDVKRAQKEADDWKKEPVFGKT